MNIPFRIKLLTSTAKPPHRNCESDLWDLYADDFCIEHLQDVDIDDEYQSYRQFLNLETDQLLDNVVGNYCYNSIKEDGRLKLHPQGRILVKTGIAIELPIKYLKRQRIGKAKKDFNTNEILYLLEEWSYKKKYNNKISSHVEAYAVADIRPRSGLALKHGITVLNSPGTIDNSYRKEIGVILHNFGHQDYKITKGDKIAQMLIRPLNPSKMEIVENIEDTQRGGFGSTGK